MKFIIAAADEKIKEQLTGSTGSKTLEEQLQFSNAIKDIESSSFVQSSFVSNRTVKNLTDYYSLTLLKWTVGEKKFAINLLWINFFSIPPPPQNGKTHELRKKYSHINGFFLCPLDWRWGHFVFVLRPVSFCLSVCDLDFGVWHTFWKL